ncbi:MAG TPA: hypothetical protein VHR42_08600, partial [Clostridia bacterium]|nr:hypothetical protein [Clostridia bacterium]
MRIISRTLSVLLMMLWDSAAVAGSVIISFPLRYGFDRVLPVKYTEFLKEYIILSIIVVLICNTICKCYMNVWRHAGINEYARQMISVLLSAAIMVFIDFTRHLGLGIELLIIIAMFEMLLMLGVRVSVRSFFFLHSRAMSMIRRKKMERVLVFGAGEAGTNLVHKLESHPEENRLPICFVDDNDSKWGKKICGLPVVGGRDKLVKTIRDY